MSKKIIIPIIVFFLMSSIVFAVEGSFVANWSATAQAPNTWGITSNGSNLFIDDNVQNKVFMYRLDGTYTGVNWSLDAGNTAPRDMTSNGTDIWVKQDTTSNVFHYLSNGTFLETFNANNIAGTNAQGIATDNKNIFITDSDDGSQIYRYTMNGTSLDNFDISNGGVMRGNRGLSTDGIFFWIVNSEANKVERFTLDGYWIKNVTSTTAGSQGVAVSGNGSRVWVVDSTGGVIEYEGIPAPVDVGRFIFFDNQTIDKNGFPITAGDLLQSHFWRKITSTDGHYNTGFDGNVWINLTGGSVSYNTSVDNLNSTFTFSFLYSEQESPSDDYFRMGNDSSGQLVSIEITSLSPNSLKQPNGCSVSTIGTGGIFAHSQGSVLNITGTWKNNLEVDWLINGTLPDNNCTFTGNAGKGINYINPEVAEGNPADSGFFRNIKIYNGTIEPRNFVADTSSPIITASISNSTPIISQQLQINGTCTDDTAVDTITIAKNSSGNLTNISSEFFGSSSGTLIFNDTAIAGTISYQFACNDTSGNSAQSSIVNYSSDTTAPIVNFVAPTPANNSIINYLTLIFNISITEPNIDKIVFNFNGTNETNTFTNDFGNFWSLSKLATSQDNYTYYIFVNDSSGNSFQSETLKFTIDNVPPVIVYTFPKSDNTTISKTSGRINIFGFNIHLISGNLSVFNSSNELIYQNLTSIDSNSFTYTDTLQQIFGISPDGIYKFSTSFKDSANNSMFSEKIMFLDNTNPSVSIFANNTNVTNNNFVNITCTYSDNKQLKNSTTSFNFSSGIFTKNFSITSTFDETHAIKQMLETSSQIINVTCRGFDTAGNQNQATTFLNYTFVSSVPLVPAENLDNEIANFNKGADSILIIGIEIIIIFGGIIGFITMTGKTLKKK